MTKLLNKVSAIVLITVFLIFMTACSKQKTDYIFVLDLSDSVTLQSRELTFETIKTRAAQLKRGDTLTVIPVTGDAQTDTTGNVLHLKVDEKRELADADLEEFYTLASQKLTKMQEKSKNYGQTDLLGAWRIVGEEIAVTKKEDRRLIIAIFSDFVHSTREVRFESDAVFANSNTSRIYAEETSKKHFQLTLESEIYLGLLESTDLRKIPNERREAIRAFWQLFFQKSGAKQLQISTDGIGQFEKFVNFKSKAG